MGVLLVTSKLAESIVRKYAEDSGVEAKVVALPFAVAALMTSRYISTHLKSLDMAGIDLILVPGLVKGDVSNISEVTGIPVFKGPRHAADLTQVLKVISKTMLSTTVPACDLIRETLNKQALESLNEIESNREQLLLNPGNVLIGNLAVGKNFPTRVIAEIVDCSKLTDKEIKRKAIHYAKSGADIIDVGMVAGLSQPKEAYRSVKIVKESVDKPISIDSLVPAEIQAAVSAGVDLILSVDAGNVAEVSKFAADIPVIVIPTDFRRNIFPRNWPEKIKLLEDNIESATKHGFKTVIADPILDPLVNPGSAESIVASYNFRKKHSDTIMLLGVGNVTELIDADSIGVNAFLMGVAAELDVGLVLTTEVSTKAWGSVQELSKAAKMMFLAKKRSSIPKEVGVDLLVLKEKIQKDEFPSNESMKNVSIINADPHLVHSRDPKGCFKIYIDRDKGEIILLHSSRHRLDTPDIVLRGRTARELYMTVVAKGLLSSLDHAGYIGTEVQKAEIALKLGKSYVQDSPIF